MFDENSVVTIGFVDCHFPGAGSRAARAAWGPAVKAPTGEPDFLPTDKLRVRHFVELGGVPRGRLLSLLQKAELLRLAAGGR